jgi:hypothetical protein
MNKNLLLIKKKIYVFEAYLEINRNEYIAGFITEKRETVIVFDKPEKNENKTRYFVKIPVTKSQFENKTLHIPRILDIRKFDKYIC